jgi:hypothetical protein
MVPAPSPLSPSSPRSVPRWQRWVRRMSTGEDPTPMNPAWLGNKVSWGTQQVYLSLNEQRQARRVLGGPDSGRTAVLATLAKGAIDSGQGLIYVDAQDNPALTLRLLGAAHRAGRSLDVRILRWQAEAPMDLPFDHQHPPGMRYEGVVWPTSNTFNPIERGHAEEIKAWLIPTLAPEEGEVGGLPWSLTRVFLDYWLDVLFDSRAGRVWPEDLQQVYEALSSETLATLGATLSLSQGGQAQALLSWWRAAFDVEHLARTPASAVWVAALQHRWKGLVDVPWWRAPQDERFRYAAELDWQEAIEQRQLVIVQLPSLTKAPPSTVRAVQGLLRHLVAVAQAHLTPWSQHLSPRGLWVFDLVHRYLTEALGQLVTQAPIWGIATVWGDDVPAERAEAPGSESLTEQCPVHVFLRQGASIEYLEQRFGPVGLGRQLDQLREAEGWVALYDRWFLARLACQEWSVLNRGVIFHPLPRWRQPLIG